MKSAGFAVAALIAAALSVVAALWLAEPSGGVELHERLGHELGCQCGTCPNRPIATCGCGFADRMLDDLRTAVDSGQDEAGIRAEFVARYGPAVEIAPSSSGFDLTAWLAPMLALMLGGVLVGWLVASWSGRSAPSEPVLPSHSAADSESGEAADDTRARDLVDREVDDLLEE